MASACSACRSPGCLRCSWAPAALQSTAVTLDKKPPDRYDVVALGALNVDLVEISNSSIEVEDTEVTTTAEEILQRIDAHGRIVLPFAGGSAFNALLMLAQLQRPRLQLALLGISSDKQQPYGLLRSHVDRLSELCVTILTGASARPPGLCSAVPTVQGRKLRPAPEANLDVVGYLDGDVPLRAVQNARILHLSSLLEDPLAPESDAVLQEVSEFVNRAKASNPSLFLSFDPGHPWVTGTDRAPLRAIYRQADLLFLNVQEFEALTNADIDSPASLRSVRHLCPGGTAVVLKGVDEVILLHAAGHTISRVPQTVWADRVDMTGAGDAVAAGVLAALAEGRSINEGCALGLRIAALRISDFGDRGHEDLLSRLGYVWSPANLELAPPGHDQRASTISNVFNVVQQTANVTIGGLGEQDLLTEIRRMIAAAGDEGTRAQLRGVEAAIRAGDEQGVQTRLRRVGRKAAELADKVAAPLTLELIRRWLGP